MDLFPFSISSSLMCWIWQQMIDFKLAKKTINGLYLYLYCICICIQEQASFRGKQDKNLEFSFVLPLVSIMHREKVKAANFEDQTGCKLSTWIRSQKCKITISVVQSSSSSSLISSSTSSSFSSSSSSSSSIGPGRPSAGRA